MGRNSHSNIHKTLLQKSPPEIQSPPQELYNTAEMRFVQRSFPRALSLVQTKPSALVRRVSETS